MAEVMRVCQLRAALSRAQGTSHFVLGSPKAWLGTAYHAVLEHIVSGRAAGENVEQAIDRLWNEAIAIQQTRASSHPLDRRFGSAENWPAYYLVRASTGLRARELVASFDSHAQHSHYSTSAESLPEYREREFTAFGGKLFGRPDLVRNHEIVDYKSGSITEFAEDAQEEVVRAAYVRQLRIYGYLVRENLGTLPRRGLLVPFAGPPVEVGLEQRDCEREAAQAVAVLDSFNADMSKLNVSRLASPSPESCKWCPFKGICPAFWQNISGNWSGYLGGEAVEGRVATDPARIHDGSAIAVSVAVERGTKVDGVVQIAPLSLQTHAAACSLRKGDNVRVTGLGKRADGSVAPTQRTVVARTADLPSLVKAART
jgi:hypothetical protein